MLGVFVIFLAVHKITVKSYFIILIRCMGSADDREKENYHTAAHLKLDSRIDITWICKCNLH